MELTPGQQLMRDHGMTVVERAPAPERASDAPLRLAAEIVASRTGAWWCGRCGREVHAKRDAAYAICSKCHGIAAKV